MARSAIVVGGGIAGLSAGIALRKAGYAVSLFEAAPKLEPIGAALSIMGNAMAGLDWLGCGAALRERAAQIHVLRLATADDRSLWGPVDIAASDCWLPMRSELQAALLAVFGERECLLGRRIDALRESAGRVEAWSGGELVAEADLAVAADGIHSTLGSDLVGSTPAYCGYLGVLGIAYGLAADRPGLSEELWAVRDRFGLFDAGNGRQYWFHLCAANEPADVGKLDQAELLHRAERFPARVSDAVTATDPASLVAVSIAARPVPRRLGRGRIICIGDAAHAMEPNQGQGGCQAIEDAWALGVLAQRLPPEAILPELERLRLPRIRRAMFDSTLVGSAVHARSALVRRALRGLIRLPPQAIARRQFLGTIAPPTYA